MHTVHNLWVSTQSFQLLVEVNGPPKADNSKIIMVNSFVAFGNRPRSGVVFHKTPCDIERQKLWLIALELACLCLLYMLSICRDIHTNIHSPWYMVGNVPISQLCG